MVNTAIVRLAQGDYVREETTWKDGKRAPGAGFTRITVGMTYSTRASYKGPMSCPKAIRCGVF